MDVTQRRLVRLIHTPAGPRYVVQVPEPQCPLPGWRAYSVLVLRARPGGPDGDGPLRLTLYERTDGCLEEPDGPQAA